MNKKNILISITLVFFLAIALFLMQPSNSLIKTVFYNDDSLQPIRKGNNDNYIAFTCNVDWGTEYIEPMLEIFDKYNIKITFFVSGRWAKNNPEVLKQIYNKGHEIGNHGYGHRMHSKINETENYNEIKKTHNIVKEILGIDMNLFAPPAGDYSSTTLQVANELGYKTILWNIDTIDWRKDSTSDKIINRVLSKPLEGSIVLMHPKKETIEALDTIINSITKKNITIGRISDILN